MAVYGNFKGTTQPGFTVGKTGAASIYGNNSSPPSSPNSGDVWMDSANTSLKIYDGTEWTQGTFVGTLEGFVEMIVEAGENLVKGDVVYVSGASGNTPVVSKAQSNSISTMPAIGIMHSNLSTGNTGHVVVQGNLTGINTSAFTEGDVLYVSSTVAGAFANTAPAGESNRIQNIGKVTNSSTGGSILVTGAGRFNATNALDSGNIFIGNGSNQAVTAPLDTSVSDLGYLKNVVEDTTPQLGGALDAQGFNITGAGSIAGTSLGVTGQFTLPTADGSANQFLKTNGAGVVSWDVGPIGYTGSVGYDGSVGFTGSKGDTGFTGSVGAIGFTGSKGDTATAGAYTHTQGSAATTWTITHNLGTQFVNVEIIDSSGNSLVGTYSYPEISFDSTSQLTATFTQATAGYASVVAGSGYTGSQGDIGFTGSSGATAGLQTVTSNGSTTNIDVTLANVESANILPSANNTYSLGSSNRVWKDVWVGPGSLHVSNQEVISGDSANIYMKSTRGNLVLSAGAGKTIYFNSPTDLSGELTLDGTLTFSGLSDGVTTVNSFQTTITNDDTAVPTSGAVVDYVSTQVGGVTLNTGGNSGTGSVDLDSESLDVTGSNGLTVTASTNNLAVSLNNTPVTAGDYGSATQIPVITVDSTGRITSAANTSITTSWTLSGDSGSETVNGGDTVTIAGGTNITTAVSATDTATVNLDNDISLGSVTATGAIQGGSLTDGTATFSNGALGGATDITASGSIQFGDLNDGSVVIEQFIDEDSMASNLANALPTQQSVKAYVDSKTGTNIGLSVSGDTGTGTVILSTSSLSIIGTSNEIATNFNDATDVVQVSIVDNPTLPGDVVITGNLTVQGTETIINSNTIASGDAIIVLNADLPSGTAPSTNGGWVLNRGSSANVRVLWDEGVDYFKFDNENDVLQQVRASVFNAPTITDQVATLTGGSLTSAVNGAFSGLVTFGTLGDGSVTIGNFQTTISDTDTSVPTSGAVVDYVTGLGYLTDVVQDTTPQLGGDLSLNGKDITGTGNVIITGEVVFDLTDGNILLGSGANRSFSTSLDSAVDALGYVKTSGTGTVTEVATSGSVNGITLTGGPITTTGTVTLGGALADVRLDQLLAANVITSAESFVDTDAQLMTAAAINDRIESFGYTTNTGTVTSVSTSGSVNGITLTGGDITTTGTVTLGGTLSGITLSQLDGTAVITSGESFQDIDTAVLTAAATEDRILSKGYTTNTGTVTSVGITGGNAVVVTNSPITTSGTIDIELTAFNGITIDTNGISITPSGVSQGTYGSATAVPVFGVNNLGQVTSVTETSIAISASQVTSGSFTSDRLTASTLDTVTTNGNTTTNDITVGNLTSTGIDDNATSTAITINSSDNVGIGATSPDSKLQITTGTNNIIQHRDATHSTLTNLTSAITFSRTDGIDDLAAIMGWNDGGVALSGREGIAFATGGGVGYSSTVESMRIDSSGKVGIGTTAPSDYHSLASQLVIANTSGDAGMSIVSSTSSDGRIFFADGTTGTSESEGQIRYDHATNSMFIVTADSQQWEFTSSGELILPGALRTTNLTTGSNATAGTVTGDWTLTAGSTWEATYADLAEKYTTDGPYEAGTVMKFGGDAELTQSDTHNDTRVAGVISDAPAFTMNGGIDGQYLALAGRVPVKVVGTVRPGDLLVASDTAGHAVVNNEPATGTVIGKAITSDANGVCEALVTLM